MANLGLQNNNPGNLKNPATGQFRVFATPQEGQQALMADLKLKQSGGSSVIKPGASLSQFANVWAPSSDNNNPLAYANTLATHLGVSPNTPFNQIPADKLAGAIQVAEGTSTMSMQPQSSSKRLTHDQLIANINAMEQQGAKPTEIQAYLNSLGNPSSVGVQQQVQQPQSSATFPYAQGDSGLTAGLKAVGNLPGSAANFGIGVAKAFNPLETLNTVGQVGSAFGELSAQEGTGKALWDTIVGLPKAAYDTLVPQGVQKILKGDVGGAAQDFTNDPFGQAAPIVLAAEGGAKLADRYLPASDALKARTPMIAGPDGISVGNNPYSAMLDRGIQRAAAPVIDTASSIGGKLASGAGTLVQHITSLSPEQISLELSKPGVLSKTNRALIDRPAIQDEFAMAVDNFIEGKGAVGDAYQPIRDAATKIAVPENWLDTALAKHGLKIEPISNSILNGEQKYSVVADSKSLTRDTKDIRAVKQFVDNWYGKSILDSNEFLNMRSDAQKIAKFGRDIGKSKAGDVIGKGIYEEANSTMRPQISGLKQLDATMSPLIAQFEQLKRDFFNPDGSFKDSATNKIATALKKPELLARMEAISPGITTRLRLLNAVEELQKYSGIKNEGLLRTYVTGSGILTGNLPAVLAAILTHPSIAIQIVRGFGLSKIATGQVIAQLKIMAGDTSTLRQVGTVGATAENPKQP